MEHHNNYWASSLCVDGADDEGPGVFCRLLCNNLGMGINVGADFGRVPGLLPHTLGHNSSLSNPD